MAVLLMCSWAISACSERGKIAVVEPGSTAGSVQSIFVGTNRKPDGQTDFGPDAGSQLVFARMEVSVPAQRKAGTVRWPTHQINLSKHFAVTDYSLIESRSGFRSSLGKRLHGSPTGERGVVVFVHGYNNTFAEGLYRLAQFATDFDVEQTLAYFSWPSAAKPLAYVGDRDKTVLSRKQFEEFLNQIVASGAEDISIVAHSMGSHLVMETMRQVSLSNPNNMQRLFSEVVLISPDIDVDVFRSQLRDIGNLPAPIWVMGSENDKALALSARITGQTNRLGNEGTTEDFSEFEVVYLDITALDDGRGGNHSTALTSEQAIDLFGDLYGLYHSFDSDPSAQIGLIPGAALSVNNSTKVIVGRDLVPNS